MRNSLNTRWRRWINRRIPRADSQILSQKFQAIKKSITGQIT